MIPHDDHLGDDVQPVMDLLNAHRPEATALELDAVKRRVLARAANRSHNPRSKGFMRSRAAILSTLVLGFLLSSTGAGLAVSGFAGNDQASVAAYPPAPSAQSQPAPADTPKTNVAPEDQSVLDETESSPEEQAAVAPSEDEVQPSRQVTAGVTASPDNELPFTGFAAIPVLLLGLALLSGGMVMRRSSRSD